MQTYLHIALTQSPAWIEPLLAARRVDKLCFTLRHPWEERRSDLVRLNQALEIVDRTGFGRDRCLIGSRLCVLQPDKYTGQTPLTNLHADPMAVEVSIEDADALVAVNGLGGTYLDGESYGPDDHPQKFLDEALSIEDWAGMNAAIEYVVDQDRRYDLVYPATSHLTGRSPWLIRRLGVARVNVTGRFQDSAYVADPGSTVRQYAVAASGWFDGHRCWTPAEFVGQVQSRADAGDALVWVPYTEAELTAGAWAALPKVTVTTVTPVTPVTPNGPVGPTNPVGPTFQSVNTAATRPPVPARSASE